MNWLLLRGLGRASGHWGDWLDRMRSLPSTGEILTLDLPGVGSEVSRPCPSSVSEIVGDVRSRLPAHFQARPFSVCAISLGGMVALEWARLHPGEFFRMILINTSAAGASGSIHRLRIPAFMSFLKIFTASDPYRRETEIFRLTSHLRADENDVVEKWVDIARETPVRRSTLLSQIVAASRFKAQPLESAPPMLFLASEKDRIVNHRCSLDLSRFYEASAQVHPEAGHDLPLDDPDWVEKQIRIFCGIS